MIFLFVRYFQRCLLPRFKLQHILINLYLIHLKSVPESIYSFIPVLILLSFLALCLILCVFLHFIGFNFILYFDLYRFVLFHLVHLIRVLGFEIFGRLVPLEG